MMYSRICRFGNQNIYDLLGRDPKSKPLNTFEMSLFDRALYEIVSKEYGGNKDNEEYPDEIPEDLKNLAEEP